MQVLRRASHAIRRATAMARDGGTAGYPERDL
jgi:hypothetical protein